MSEIKRLAENSTPNNFDIIYEKIEKNPEIKVKIEERIVFLASQLSNIKNTDPASIYEQFFGLKYTGTPEQLARVFSFVYREIRANVFELDTKVTLSIEEGNGEKRILQNGARLTYLGETREEKVDKKIIESILVKYEDTIGNIPKLLIPKKFLKNADKSTFNSNLITVNLNNENSRLNVRSENNLNKKILQFKHGMTVKDLGKTKEFNGRTFTLVEFFNKNGETSRGYIAKSYTKKVKEESLKTVDLYIRSLGLNPTVQFKKDIFKKVYTFKEYRGHLGQSETINPERVKRDNTEVYNMLIINFELRKLIEIEEQKLVNNKEIQDLKDKQSPQNGNQNLLNKQESQETLPKDRKEQKEGPDSNGTDQINNNENLNIKVLEKIRNDKKIVGYLEKKYKRKNFKQNLALIKKSIGYKGNNFRDNVMTFTYLFQKSRGFKLYEYYFDITRKNFGDLKGRSKVELFNKYAGEVNEIYGDEKVSNNLTILRGMIIENELGIDFVKGIKREKAEDPDFQKSTKTKYRKALQKSKEDYKKEPIWVKYGVDTTKLRVDPVERDNDGDTKCSRGVYNFFHDKGIETPLKNASILIDTNNYQEFNFSSLEEVLDKLSKNKKINAADILIETRIVGGKGHRVILVLSRNPRSNPENNHWDIGDVYYKHKGKNKQELYPFKEHWAVKKGLKFMINGVYKIEV